MFRPQRVAHQKATRLSSISCNSLRNYPNANLSNLRARYNSRRKNPSNSLSTNLSILSHSVLF